MGESPIQPDNTGGKYLIWRPERVHYDVGRDSGIFEMFRGNKIEVSSISPLLTVSYAPEDKIIKDHSYVLHVTSQPSRGGWAVEVNEALRVGEPQVGKPIAFISEKPLEKGKIELTLKVVNEGLSRYLPDSIYPDGEITGGTAQIPLVRYAGERPTDKQMDAASRSLALKSMIAVFSDWILQVNEKEGNPGVQQ